MSELNFCPQCDAPQHKLLNCKDDVFFCKECHRFFRFDFLDVNCDRCNVKLVKSDFDSPTGGAVFYCTKCKRTYPAAEIVERIS